MKKQVGILISTTVKSVNLDRLPTGNVVVRTTVDVNGKRGFSDYEINFDPNAIDNNRVTIRQLV
jgi:hypothetical protein